MARRRPWWLSPQDQRISAAFPASGHASLLQTPPPLSLRPCGEDSVHFLARADPREPAQPSSLCSAAKVPTPAMWRILIVIVLTCRTQGFLKPPREKLCRTCWAAFAAAALPNSAASGRRLPGFCFGLGSRKGRADPKRGWMLFCVQR